MLNVAQVRALAALTVTRSTLACAEYDLQRIDPADPAYECARDRVAIHLRCFQGAVMAATDADVSLEQMWAIACETSARTHVQLTRPSGERDWGNLI